MKPMAATWRRYNYRYWTPAPSISINRLVMLAMMSMAILCYCLPACAAFIPIPNHQQQIQSRSSSGDQKSLRIGSNNAGDGQGESKTTRTSEGRKFRKRNGSGNGNVNGNGTRRGTRSGKAGRGRSNNGYRRNRSQQLLQSSFTRTLIAPSLQDTDLRLNSESGSDIQESTKEGMEYFSGDLPVTYTNDPQTVERWLCDHVNNNYAGGESAILKDDASGNNNSDGRSYSNAFLGFDVEAAPNLPWRKPTNRDFIDRPATIQMSSPYSSLVIHLTDKKVLPPLQAMLSDETILKVGVGIDEDMLELYRWDATLNARGRFDVAGIGPGSKRTRMGLQKIVRALVGVELPKSKKVAMSDWSQVPLSSQQLVYASRDAWAGAAVMENLGRDCRDEMHVDLIAKMVKENERDMAEVDERARRRKKARIKSKGILADAKEMAFEMDPDKKFRLKDLMSTADKEEMDRLQIILDETAPDGILFFDSDELGLDFSNAELS